MSIKKNRLAVFLVATLVFAGSAAADLQKKTVRKDRAHFSFDQGDLTAYPCQKHLRASFTIQNKTAFKSQTSRLWVNVFVEKNSLQAVTTVKTSRFAQLSAKDTHGNVRLMIQIGPILPYATEIINVDINLQTSKVPQPVFLEPARYLNAERLMQKDHESIRLLARKLKKKKAIESARSYYNWITRNIARSSYRKQDMGALYALENKKGDCTEHASLFVALCRATGIPARLMGGYFCQGGCTGEQVLHMWAEFYVQGHWKIADPYSGNFDENGSAYRAIENYNSDSKHKPKNFHRYYLEIMEGEGNDQLKIRSRYTIS